MDDTISLAGIVRQSIVDGPGLRLTIFTQGCPHHCEGCHNPNTWPFEGGTPTKADTILRELDKNPLLSGVTLSGGEPLAQPEALLPLAEGVLARGKNIVCYTGYTFEELLVLQKDNPPLRQLLSLISILIDGRFVLPLRDLTLTFRGSQNQRVLDLPRSLEVGEAILLEEYM